MLETDQKVDVDHCPCHPGYPALELEAPVLVYRCVAAPNPGVASSPIAEWRQRGSGPNVSRRGPAQMFALLLRSLREPVKRPSIFSGEGRDVAEGEHTA